MMKSDVDTPRLAYNLMARMIVADHDTAIKLKPDDKGLGDPDRPPTRAAIRSRNDSTGIGRVGLTNPLTSPDRRVGPWRAWRLWEPLSKAWVQVQRGVRPWFQPWRKASRGRYHSRSRRPCF